MQIIESISAKWGVSVESILIKDINFSKELMESLSSAATQRRLAEAKVIAAQAEVDSAKLFRQAADILSSPAALQIRQIEVRLSCPGAECHPCAGPMLISSVYVRSSRAGHDSNGRQGG